MPSHPGSATVHLGGKWAIILFVLVLIAFVTESQFTQYVQTDLGFRQPYLVFYIVHVAFSIMLPLHLAYLVITTDDSPRALWAGLKYALRQHIKPTRLDTPSAFPIYGFSRLVLSFTVMMAIPALLWFIAVTLAPLADVTALWNTNAFFAYVLTVKLCQLRWEPRRLAAVLLATLGSLAVIYGGSSSPRDSPSSPNPLLGDLLTLIASVVYGVYQVLYKMYAALPSDPDAVEVQASYTPIGEDVEDFEESSPLDKTEMVYPPPFALYANFLTTSIGIGTLLVLWIPIPLMHLFGIETFRLPPDLTTTAVIAAIALSGVVFNAGLMVLLGLWGPVVTSVGNLLTIVLVFISDAIFGGAVETVTVWSVLGSGAIVAAFGILAWDMLKGK